ncbi:hypothetical protein BK816_06110 [Boudabousia tangfeifanii]|uniref:ABC transporter domain-containing protein n=2 Tax=Boudabousia tangfeifanii TaxID=1912795 RepID=A0A1D9ML04_9ACTO|nr:hypothetical protein BK816_06110 [Boudabousia tangfeifanii]
MEVAPGEVVAVLGPNGSGKSTLIKAILGCAPVIKGQVELFGKPSKTPKGKIATQIGYVPQRFANRGGISASALEVVESGLSGPSLFHQFGARKKALAALDSVGMSHKAHDPVDVLSGGQHQRVLIARALIRQPQLLVMDEPLAGIDAQSAHTLADILAEQKANGVAVVLVLHDLGCLESLIDQIVLLTDGKVVEAGPAAQFAAESQRLTAMSHSLCGETGHSLLGGEHL